MIQVCLSPARSYLRHKNLRLAVPSRRPDTTRVQRAAPLGPSRKNGARVGSGRKESARKDRRTPKASSFRGSSVLAPASWSAAVRSAALDCSPLHRRQQRKRIGERGNRIFTGG